jgi:hypothetical protein
MSLSLPKNGMGTYDLIIQNKRYSIEAGMGVYIRVGIVRQEKSTLGIVSANIYNYLIVVKQSGNCGG